MYCVKVRLDSPSLAYRAQTYGVLSVRLCCMFFMLPTNTHTHTEIVRSIDKMVAYIHEPAVHLHNRWQQAAAGDATWRTLPFILVPACLLNWFSCSGGFWAASFTRTHTHIE